MLASLLAGIDEEETQRQYHSEIEEAHGITKGIIKEDVGYHWQTEEHQTDATPHKELTTDMALIRLQERLHIAYLEEEKGKRDSGKGQELHQELQTDHLCALYVGPVAWEDEPKFVHSNDYQRDNTRTIKLRKEYFSCFIHRFV